MIGGIREYRFHSGFGAKVTDAFIVSIGISFEFYRYRRQAIRRTNRSTGNNTNATGSNVSDNSVIRCGKPTLDSGINYLKRRRIPTMGKNYLAGTSDRRILLSWRIDRQHWKDKFH